MQQIENEFQTPADTTGRGRFLAVAVLFEAGLVLLALALGWWAKIDPLGTLGFDWISVVWGLGAAMPLFGLFLLSQWARWEPLARIRRFLVDVLGPPLAACRWYDILLLSLLVGFAEELLFRGVLQPWFESWGGWTLGIAASNVLFALAHCITVLYTLVAGLMGVYLGWLLDASGERRLLVPVLTHAFYDYLAFLFVARAYRRERRGARDEGQERVRAFG